MGWLWASPSAKGENTSSSSQQLPSQQSTPNNSENTTNNNKPAESPTAVYSSSSSSSSSPSSSSSSSSSTSYNPYTDPELVRFMSQLNTELRSTSPSSTSPSTSQSSSSWFSSAPDPAGAPGPLDPLSESLLPRKMSCQQSFDQAFYCNSFGGQWMSVYRTGAARSCSEYWSEFWFCMRARSMRGEARANTVRDYYRRREVARYGPGRPSSTDVWEPRTERLPPGEAFSQPYVAPEVDDEEWRRLEIQRRRMVREYLDREAQQEKEEREKKRAARAARIKAKQEAAAAAATAEPK